MSDPTRRRSPRTACSFWVPLVTVGALVLSLLLSSGRASAQATAPAPQPAPSLEAGDTAAPAGDPPLPAAPGAITPLAPLAPPPTVTAPPYVYVGPPPAPRPQPIYRKHWFWGAVGVLVITGAILLSVALSNTDPPTPNTRLGDMRAF